MELGASLLDVTSRGDSPGEIKIEVTNCSMHGLLQGLHLTVSLIVHEVRMKERKILLCGIFASYSDGGRRILSDRNW